MDQCSIKRVTKTQELIELIEIFNQEFEESKNPCFDNIELLITDTNFVGLLALWNEKIVGGLTGYILRPYDQTKRIFYLYDLAVHHSLHRKGIGTRLFKEAEMFCKTHSISHLFVQADMEDTHALEYYRSLKGLESEVIQFDFEYP